MDFHKILHLSIFRKPVEKFQFFLQYDKNNGYFTWGGGKYIYSGFGGLAGSALASGTKVRGFNPAEAVGFFGRKKFSARLPSEGK
jgi:hypothetical protein